MTVLSRSSSNSISRIYLNAAQSRPGAKVGNAGLTPLDSDDISIAPHNVTGHTCPIMSFVGGLFRSIFGVTTSVVLMLGCGGKSASDTNALGATTGGSATTLSTAQGGSSGVGGASSSVATGGTGGPTTSTQSMTGGASAYPIVTGGANTSGTGGNKPMVTGGAVGTGGSIVVAAGGRANTGGTTNIGGTGGTTSTSSSPSAGGKVSTGGAVGTGGKLSTGGAVNTGGNPPITGGSSAGGSAGTGATGGVLLADFCTGSVSKVNYQGQELQAPVTNYESALVLDCCSAYGVNWHTGGALGFDLDAEVISRLGGSSGTEPGLYPLDGTAPLSVAVHRSTDTAFGVATRGTAELVTAFSFNAPWVLGLCLEVSDTASDLFGTRLYAPQVTIATYASHSRFQIFLLSDRTILAEQAAAMPLDSLLLAQSPLIDLGDIAFVQSTGQVGLNPGQHYGDSILSALGNGLDHVPFVVVADGARVYLGTFANVSQRVTSGPLIWMYRITSNAFDIEPPMNGADPRNDARIVKALTETGKFIP